MLSLEKEMRVADTQVEVRVKTSKWWRYQRGLRLDSATILIQVICKCSVSEFKSDYLVNDSIFLRSSPEYII